jgi:hypothetical protein
MRQAAIALMLLVYCITAAADELPNDLFLRCEGKLRVMMLFRDKSVEPVLRDEKFNITLHLKQGSMIDVTDNLVLGRGCIFAEGEIGCGLKEVKQVKELNAVETRRSTISLTRSTGELRALWQVESFDGPKAMGTPSSRAQVERAGTCRKGDPIF